MKFKKGDTVIYPQHGACKVESISKQDPLNTGKVQDYLVLRTVIGEMTLRVPMSKVDEVGVRPPVSPDELEDLVAVLAKADPRVPSNWSRRYGLLNARRREVWNGRLWGISQSSLPFLDRD